ncbi:hypothetical protein V8C35DRAFT_197950 [Trichoderma chlorosporum]
MRCNSRRIPAGYSCTFLRCCFHSLILGPHLSLLAQFIRSPAGSYHQTWLRLAVGRAGGAQASSSQKMFDIDASNPVSPINLLFAVFSSFSLRQRFPSAGSYWRCLFQTRTDGSENHGLLTGARPLCQTRNLSHGTAPPTISASVKVGISALLQARLAPKSVPLTAVWCMAVPVGDSPIALTGRPLRLSSSKKTPALQHQHRRLNLSTCIARCAAALQLLLLLLPGSRSVNAFGTLLMLLRAACPRARPKQGFRQAPRSGPQVS